MMGAMIGCFTLGLLCGIFAGMMLLDWAIRKERGQDLGKGASRD